MKVIVRPPGEAFRNALSEHPGRDSIDVTAACGQHAAFVAALREAGVALVEMPPDDELPDACFVSDVLITLPAADDPGGPAAIAVATRPGAPSRRPEVAAVLDTARRLVGAACRIAEIAAPGTLDGGDVIVYGDRVAIGVSARTDRQAAEQLAGPLRAAGYRPFLCPVEGRLHLASWVTVVRPDLLIGTAGGFVSLEAGGPEVAPRDQVGRITLSDEEVVAANVLPLAGRVFVAAGNPGAVAALRDAGEHVVELDLSEFTKADGGPTCLVSHVF
jgi:dimethylargininase